MCCIDICQYHGIISQFNGRFYCFKKYGGLGVEPLGWLGKIRLRKKSLLGLGIYF
jgi:hypothetical protein